MSSSSVPCVAVFCDFNGTITNIDMLHALATACGFPDLSEWLGSAAAEDLALRERLSAQASVLTFSLEDAETIVDRTVAFDETFPAFYRKCVENGIEFTVLSSGITELIEHYLCRRGLNNVPIIANGAEYRRDGWRLAFRDSSPQGNSKFDRIAQAQSLGKWTIMIGDDESDFEAAVIANHRIAKRGSALDRFLDAR